MRHINIERADGVTEDCIIYNVDDFPYRKYMYEFQTVKKRNRKGYINASASFDIECTTIRKKTDEEMDYGFMYLWQFCLVDTVVMGRTWQEFVRFVQRLNTELELSPYRTLVVYVHFLGYEFQFMRNFIQVDRLFATEKRKPIIVESGNIEFRCSYRLSNMSLAKFCENSKLCTFYKRDGEQFNYEKVRTPATELTDYELTYAYCDVRGLCQCIDTLLLEDTIATIPLTSTGYVRRECRIAVNSNPKNRERLQKSALTPNTYMLCKTARRGGNTHANAIYTLDVIGDGKDITVKSYDKQSSYPASMMLKKYPCNKFVRVAKLESLNKALQDGQACLIDLVFENLRKKRIDTIPYIAKAKCTGIKGARIDNGRVISAERCAMVITDVDWFIIESQYEWDSIELLSCHIADYDFLPKEFRQELLEMFIGKCKLKGKDSYNYMKFKNKFNATFGMMLTDICSPEVIYEDSEEPWKEQDTDVAKALEHYYNSRNSFLSYQHGVWVTAHSRAELQKGLDIVGRDALYCDTDSVKYIGDYDSEFESLNSIIREECESVDVPAYCDINGKRFYLGEWEVDGEYAEFKTLGAKKYAYRNIGEQELHITVAGLSKKAGAEYVNAHGGFECFHVGQIVPESNSGRTTSTYNDVDKPYYITVDGCRILTASNIGIAPTTYTFGISDEYADFIEYATHGENFFDK